MEEKHLRSGFTTGTCAAAAAKAAAAMLLTGEKLPSMAVVTPKGKTADLPLFHIIFQENMVSCAVQKDAGDDPDVTNGTMVFASAEYVTEQEAGSGCYCWKEGGEDRPLFLTAGKGIGQVTKPGLSCPVGMPAINPVPRTMIFEGVEEVRKKAGFGSPLKICIWMPEGERLAEKTFNPRLGVVGGLSVLGTTGIVDPMSEDALKATIALELHMKAAEGHRKVILTPGNYGEKFIRETLGLSMDRGVICSNFIGDALGMAEKEGFKQILLIGHLGKLIKTAGGAPNTHSKYGDRRMEILKECLGALPQGKSLDKSRILNANTTEEAVEILKDWGVLESVMKEAVDRMQCFASLWAGGISVEVVTFSTVHGILGASSGAGALIRLFAETD